MASPKLDILVKKIEAHLSSIKEYTPPQPMNTGGAMGKILSSKQAALWRDVVIKQIAPGLRDTDEKKLDSTRAFLSEAFVTSYLDHPNIVPVYGLGRDGDEWFYSMKIVKGTEWSKLLASNKSDEAIRINQLEDNLRILDTVCNAVRYAHDKGIINRDLKPENVMIGKLGEVYVIDWGLAVDIHEVELVPKTGICRALTRAECNVAGTSAYMSPESRKGQVSFQSDIFLLGAILYELLTGDPPFKPTASEVVVARKGLNEHPSIDENSVQMASYMKAAQELVPPPGPPELVQICLKAMAMEPRDRFESVEAFQLELKGYLKHNQAERVAAKAKTEAEKGKGHRSFLPLGIQDLARAVSLYEQALDLWPTNPVWPAELTRTRKSLGVKERLAFIYLVLLVAAAVIIVVALITTLRLLKEQRRLAFEAVVRNAEVDDSIGESEKVIKAVEPYRGAFHLKSHHMQEHARELFEKAKNGYKRFEAFNKELKAGAPTATLDLGNNVKLEMIRIPAGTYIMGSPAGEPERVENETPHTVTISQPFYMGKFHVTQEQYKAVMSAAPNCTAASSASPSFFKNKPKNPVEQVTWNEAEAFCKKLTLQAGPESVTVSLPTEAQWEYACRGGTASAYYFGDMRNQLEFYAWYQINAGEDTPGFGTHPAGVKNRPNKFGLHDMHGNVYCWCADWYDSAYYSKSPAVDPPGSAAGADLGDGTGPLRVIRGGSYRSDQQACRAAYRGSFPSENRYSTIGFRVVVKP